MDVILVNILSKQNALRRGYTTQQQSKEQAYWEKSLNIDIRKHKQTDSGEKIIILTTGAVPKELHYRE